VAFANDAIANLDYPHACASLCPAAAKTDVAHRTLAHLHALRYLPIAHAVVAQLSNHIDLGVGEFRPLMILANSPTVLVNFQTQLHENFLLLNVQFFTCVVCVVSHAFLTNFFSCTREKLP
jgi:hypothetical protein